MKIVRSAILVAAFVSLASAGCCGPHPIRDRWCESWGQPPSSYQPAYYQQQPYAYQPSCTCQPVQQVQPVR